MRSHRYLFAALVLLTSLITLCSLGLAQEEAELPERVSFVSDYAELYDEENEEQLNNIMAAVAIEQELVIDLLTVQTIGDLSIEAYGDAIEEAWGISEVANVGRHLLIIIAVDEGMYNLVTTPALSRYLPDSELARINDEYILPAIEESTIQAAVVVGIEQIIDSYANAVEHETPVHTASGSGFLRLSDVLGILMILGGLALLLLLNSLSG